MMDVKRQKRSYRSPKRAAQAAETREAVLSAAHRLFLTHGWTKTTIASVAAEAGVANETVYAGFGSKRALFREVISRTVRGAEPEKPLIQQETPGRIARLRDQRAQIELFADDITKVLGRVAPLMEVAREAAATDAEMAELYARLHAGRRVNLEWFTAALIPNGPLKSGMDAAEAASIAWRLASPELFLLMQRVEGVSQRAYAEWLARSLKLQLLD